jgi:exosortase A
MSSVVKTETLQRSRWLPGLALLALLLLLFWDTAASMVTIWMRSETFAHAFLVPPIVAWLAWRKRDQLARLQPEPTPWLLLPLAAVCFLWLMGSLASVNAATQLALVMLIVLVVPALFGFAVTRVLLFPLLFLFFAVPIGEFMVPPMMEWTADFTVWAVAASGVPVYREGLQFVIPSGNWSVVEACSGVRYLIASFMVGSLFAYLNYHSLKRRLIFVGVALLLPIVANWVRAYMIVMLGHLSGNKIAAGADHLVYGWVFFGVIIAAMFMIGARWAEPEPAVPSAGTAPAAAAPNERGNAGWWVMAGLLGLLIGTQGLQWRLDHVDTAGAVPRIVLPAELPGGWARQAEAVTDDWTPAWQGASASARSSYRSPSGAVAALWVGYYNEQNGERKMVSSTNALIEPGSAVWVQTSGGSARAALAGGGDAVMRTAVLRRPANPNVSAVQRLQVAYLYWVGGRFTASDARAKLYLAWDRLLGRGGHGAVVVLYAPMPLEGKGDAGALSGFAAAQLPLLAEQLARVSREPAR